MVIPLRGWRDNACEFLRADCGLSAAVMIFSARGVILGIGSENEEHVEREAQWIALNLNVAFLHDVEEADLDFSGKVGELI